MDPLRRKLKEPYNPLRNSRPPQRRPPVPPQSQAPPPKFKRQLVEEEPEPDYEDSTEWTCYTLTTTKRSILTGNRYHVMRLHPKFVEVPDPADKTGEKVIMVPETVNITDPETFKQPIRLHRRDATAPLAGKNEAEASKLEIPKPIDEEEQKRLEFKAEKARRREELMSKVAPDGGGRNNFKIKGEKKTQQVRQSNAEQVANRKMRYEEEYPWFLEDADNGQTWQGQREHAMSNGEFAVLYMDHVQGSFNMIPVEKWYRFTKVKRVNKMTEKEIKAGEKVLSGEEPALPSWAKKAPKEEFVETEELTKMEQRLYAKNAALVPKRQIKTVKGREESNQGNEELDFNVEDQFDNDDTGGLLGDFGDGNEGEEAAKDAAKRIIKDQLSANVFGSRTEKDIIEERRKLKMRQKLLKEHGKKVSKALKRREGNYIYDSDEEDPYLNKLLSASDNDSSSDSDAEAEEFKKWKLELKKAAAEKEAEEARKVEAKKETVKRAMEKRKAKKQAEKGESPAGDIPTSAPATPALIPHAVSKSTRNEVKSRKRSRSPESQISTKRRCNDPAPNASINSPHNSPAPQPRANVKKRPRSPEPAKPQKPSGLLKRRRQNKVVADNTISVPEQKNTNSASPTVSKSPSPSTNIPVLPITDEEIIAVLRADPEGVSSKDITEAFRSRIKAGTKDVSALAQRLKQFGSSEGNIKKWKLKKEFI